MSNNKDVKFRVYGEPASKANSRRMVINRKTGRPMFIKSPKALKYTADFRMQCPKFNEPREDDVEVDIKIYYASRRPDLDESIILDAMQGLIYKNDRQVKRKTVEWGLDKENPRAEIFVWGYRG